MIQKNESAKHAVIFTGGFCDTTLLDPADLAADFYIAADAGWMRAVACNITPDIVAGDFDSSEIPHIFPQAEIITVPSEKDDTDTMLACDIAIARGYNHILIIGGTGGRIDHGLSNIFLLEKLCEASVFAIMDDGQNRVRLLKNEHCRIEKSRFRYFSLLALEDAHVTVKSAKYPLVNAPLTRSNPYAVSNEILGSTAEIEVSGGAVLLIESDAH